MEIANIKNHPKNKKRKEIKNVKKRIFDENKNVKKTFCHL
jgi:hypothetical protein